MQDPTEKIAPVSSNWRGNQPQLAFTLRSSVEVLGFLSLKLKSLE